MDRRSISFDMGSRLKSLREKKNLSYQGLADALLNNYGIKISKDSLRDYEITSDYRAKAKSLPNLGMRTEYLYVLADFYKVSTDYLLGLSKYKNYNTRKITLEQLGVSSEAADVQANLWGNFSTHNSAEVSKAIKMGAYWPYYRRIRDAFYGSEKQYFDILCSVARYVSRVIALRDAKNITTFPNSAIGYNHTFESKTQRDKFLERHSPLSRSYVAFELQNTIMGFIDNMSEKIADDVLGEK